MSEPTRRFTGRQITTMVVAGMAAVVLFPVAVSAAPTAFSLVDRTGALHAGVTKSGQVKVTGPVVISSASSSVKVTGTTSAVTADTTVPLFNGKTCTTTGTSLVTVNTAAYKQIRIFLRNNDTTARGWRLFSVINDGVNNNSYTHLSTSINGTFTYTETLDLPGAEVRFDCNGVIVANGGMSINIVGRKS